MRGREATTTTTVFEKQWRHHTDGGALSYHHAIDLLLKLLVDLVLVDMQDTPSL